MRKLGLAGLVVFVAMLALPAAAATRTNGPTNTRLGRSELVAPGDVTGAIESWRAQVYQRAAPNGPHGSSTSKNQPWWSGNPPAAGSRNANKHKGDREDEGDEDDQGDDEDDQGDDEDDEGDDEEDDVSPSTPF